MRSFEVIGLLVVLLTSAVAFGCDRSDGEPAEAASYANDVAVICQAPMNCEECALVAPELRMQTLVQLILDEVETAEARAFMDSLAQVAPAERVRMLREQADSVGLEGCPLADEWEEGIP